MRTVRTVRTALSQEERIHPYGRVDLGEVPFAMANFAKRLGINAQSYCHGDLERGVQQAKMGRMVENHWNIYIFHGNIMEI